MDRRELKSNGRVAHNSLQGQVVADHFVQENPMRVSVPVASLFDSIAPGHWNRERELVLHDVFHVLEESSAWVFGYAEKDGYVGYMRRVDLAHTNGMTPTHTVSTRQSYLTTTPKLKNKSQMAPISFGTAFQVLATHENGRWAEIATLHPSSAFIPAQHLRPIGAPETDPANVAERFLGTPYHWGGNSGFGIDCSGLVQAALLACAIPCPGDSDQQEANLGNALPKGTSVRRNDLLFWKGHVALVVSDSTLIHANAHHMAVSLEGIDTALARIDNQGDGQMTRHKRLNLPLGDMP